MALNPSPVHMPISAGVLAGAGALALGFVFAVPQGFTWGGAVTVLTLAPLLVPERYRHIGTGLSGIAILAVVGVSILSIGPYFLPSLACMVFSSVAYFLARPSSGVRRQVFGVRPAPKHE